MHHFAKYNFLDILKQNGEHFKQKFYYANVPRMNECVHSLRCECIWCKHESEKLNTKDFQQGQLPLIQKVTEDLFFD